jgi:elongation factor 1-beta
MAIVAVKIRLMPVSPDTDLEKIKVEAEKRINQLDAKVHASEIEPIAFGLKALMLTLIWPEEKNPDLLENAMKSIDQVESAEIVDVRRASF